MVQMFLGIITSAVEDKVHAIIFITEVVTIALKLSIYLNFLILEGRISPVGEFWRVRELRRAFGSAV
jgi:hypothetical protein